MFSRMTSLRILGYVCAIFVVIWAFYSFFEAVFWSAQEHDTSDLPLSVVIFLSLLCLSGIMVYSLYKNCRLMFRNTFIVSWLIPVMAIGRFINSIYTRHYTTEEALHSFGFTGNDLQTAAFILCFLQIVLSAVPTVTFHLLWIWNPREGDFHPIATYSSHEEV